MDVRSYGLLAEILARHLSSAGPPTAAALAAGDAWGRSLAETQRLGTKPSEEAALTALLRTLRVIGFAPELVAEGREVLLRHCPFLEVAQAHRDVVCSVHLGLMRGILDGMAAPVAAEELRPFVQPTLCVAVLRERAIAS